MKYLVDGSSGFIGSHLTARIQERGDQVHKLSHVFLDADSLPQLITQADPDYIMHLAGYGNMHTHTNGEAIIRANILGITHLLFASILEDYQGLVNVSTSSVLLPEHTLYASTKRIGELTVETFLQEYDKPVVTVRPYSVYGEREADFRFIPTVLRSIYTGEPMTLAPDAAHDWIYVKDLCDVLLDTAKNAALLKGLYVNAGTGIQTTNAAIVALLEEITGKKATIKKEETLRSFDTAHWSSDQLNMPKDIVLTPLVNGLTETVKYYENKYKTA